jgi:hypothetical protein
MDWVRIGLTAVLTYGCAHQPAAMRERPVHEAAAALFHAWESLDVAVIHNACDADLLASFEDLTTLETPPISEGKIVSCDEIEGSAKQLFDRLRVMRVRAAPVSPMDCQVTESIGICKVDYEIPVAARTSPADPIAARCSVVMRRTMGDWKLIYFQLARNSSS